MNVTHSKNTLNCLQSLVVNDKTYGYFSIDAAADVLGNLNHLPCTMRIILENLLRNEDEKTITVEDMRAVAAFHALRQNPPSMPFVPTRLLIDDKRGLSVMTDMAALIDAVAANRQNPKPLSFACPLDIVIEALESEAPEATQERMRLLKWGQHQFSGITIIDGDNGNSNHINLNTLSQVVCAEEDGDEPLLYPDTVLGTNSSLPLVGAMGMLSWRIDTLEAEDILLGNSSFISLPHVIGVKITGQPNERTTITDIALALSSTLRQQDCSDKFVEFYGAGVDLLSIPDRILICNFVIACGALSAIFPIDQIALDHLKLLGQKAEAIALTEAYAKAQGLWLAPNAQESTIPRAFSSKIEFSLNEITPSYSNNTADAPISLASSKAVFEKQFAKEIKEAKEKATHTPAALVHLGDIVWADIGSCSTACHHLEIITAGLFARKAAAKGLKVKPWVYAIFNSSSPYLDSFLKNSGLIRDFEKIGFKINVQTSSANSPSADLQKKFAAAVANRDLTVCSLSTDPLALGLTYSSSLHLAPYTASPLFVAAYAIVGSLLTDISTQALGLGSDGTPVLLNDLWPTSTEVANILEPMPLTAYYAKCKQTLPRNNAAWDQVPLESNPRFPWQENSLYLKPSPFLDGKRPEMPKLHDIEEIRILAIYGSNVQASDMAPGGIIAAQTPAAHYLATFSSAPTSQQSYNSFTGNHQIMVRGAFMKETLANKLLLEEMPAPAITIHAPTKTKGHLINVAENYNLENTPTLLVAGQRFGHGTGQEWAAKAIRLLGVRAVIAESFDPGFRLNLIRVGILPLQFKSGVSVDDLHFKTNDFIHFAGLADIENPSSEIMMTVEHSDETERHMLFCRLNSPTEIELYRHGSIWEKAFRRYLAIT